MEMHAHISPDEVVLISDQHPIIEIDDDDIDDEIICSPDEVVLISDQHPIIEIDDDDTDDEIICDNNQAFLSAPKILKHEAGVVSNEEETVSPFKRFKKHVDDDEADRIPIYKNTVELLCKYFGIDFKPEWTLSQIRRICKEKMKKYKETPELKSAINMNRRAHLWCRGLFFVNLPDWFQTYHVITLIRMMSTFNVSQPTYIVKMRKRSANRDPADPQNVSQPTYIVKMRKRSANRDPATEDPADPNTGGCEMIFLNIEDCRKVFYDMQGIQCFNNKIVVRVNFGLCYKKFKLQRSRKAINRIQLFRREQTVWCPNDGGSEMDDSDEETWLSYIYPRICDVENDFKRRYDAENVPFEKEAQRYLGKAKTYSIEEDIGLQNTKKTEHILPSTKNVQEKVVPVVSNTKNKAEHILPSTKNVKEKVVPVAPQSIKTDVIVESRPKTKEETCRTIVMDKIPKLWNNLLINNFIKNAVGRAMDLTIRALSENTDDTIKYLIILPTHEDAIKVIKELNGTIVYNKKILIQLNPDYAIDEDRPSTVKRKLVSNMPTANNQPPPKISEPVTLPTASPTVASRSGLVQNIPTRAPNTNQRLTKETQEPMMLQAALLYEDPPQSITTNNPKQNSDLTSNTQNQRSQIAVINKTIEQLSENSNQNKIINDNSNSNKPSQNVVGTLETRIKEIDTQETKSQENRKENVQTREETSVIKKRENPTKERRIEKDSQEIKQSQMSSEIAENNEKQYVNVKKEPVQDNRDNKPEIPNIVLKQEPNITEDSFIGVTQRKSCNEKKDMLIFKNLPPSVSSEALASKLGEFGEVLFCELTATNRAVVRLRDPRHAELCQRLFNHSRVDGRVIEVTLA